MREFACDLPRLLEGRGVDLLPWGATSGALSFRIWKRFVDSTLGEERRGEEGVNFGLGRRSSYPVQVV